MKMNNRLKIGIIILTIFILASLILPIFNEVDPTKQGIYPKNSPVSAEHVLGTNSLGQDIFWFLILSIRNSLILGSLGQHLHHPDCGLCGAIFRIRWRLG